MDLHIVVMPPKEKINLPLHLYALAWYVLIGSLVCFCLILEYQLFAKAYCNYTAVLQSDTINTLYQMQPLI